MQQAVPLGMLPPGWGAPAYISAEVRGGAASMVRALTLSILIITSIRCASPKRRKRRARRACRTAPASRWATSEVDGRAIDYWTISEANKRAVKT
ncbi:hypothetical protein [Massilia yuzhufengensis]|uniref:hypothetical protein n=1 Tax=Massilia yuzhufengensis TaxID=1164594 RepID=UPI0015A5AE78|nr:hypothetical protein [Massilia yuzhufengensis]